MTKEELKEKLKKYCYRYDSSVGKGWFDEERLQELLDLFTKHSRESNEKYLDGFFEWLGVQSLGNNFQVVVPTSMHHKLIKQYKESHDIVTSGEEKI